MLLVYLKNEQDDLTPQQAKVLSKLVKEVPALAFPPPPNFVPRKAGRAANFLN